MRLLATLLAAASISYAAACPAPNGVEPVEPRVRDDRIEWRSRVGIQAAHAFVFDDETPIENLEEALACFGSPLGLSSRDVAESMAWGLFHYREDLPPSDATTIEEYLEEQIGIYGERFVAITQILYGRGPYTRTIQWYLYDPIKYTIGADSPEGLTRNISRALVLASPFIDTQTEYDRMRESWNGSHQEAR